MTDKLRQAAEMALKALKNKTTVYVRWDDGVVEATEILEEALTQALAEPDTGIDRGAWSDVPDATKWVEELRGGDDFEEPPDSPTDVVEPEPFGWLFNERDGNLYKLLQGKDVEWVEKNNPYWVKATPLYTAPPKREWVSLTDDEIAEIRRNGSHSVRDADFRAIEAKLKELNT